MDEDVIPPVGRSATIEAEEGRANVNLHRRAKRAAGLHAEDEDILEKVLENQDGNSTEKEPQASPDAVFLFQLRATERYEKGLVFGALLWVPMLFLLLKIYSGTGGWGLWGPKVCGCMFFCSWLVPELITIVASRQQLSVKQRTSALKLGRLWRKSLEALEVRHAKKKLDIKLKEEYARLCQLIQRKWEGSQHGNIMSAAELDTIDALERQLSKDQSDTFSKLYKLERKDKKETFEMALIDPRRLFFPWELEGAFILSRICCTILPGFNAWPLVARTAAMYFSPYWRYYRWVDSFLWQVDWSESRKSWMSPIEYFTLYFFVLFPFLAYTSVYFTLIYLAVSPWPLSVLNVLCCGIPGTILQRKAWAMVLVDMDGLVPGYLALGQAILTILRFTRVLNDYASYDCSSTTRSSWYDWTL